MNVKLVQVFQRNYNAVLWCQDPHPKTDACMRTTHNIPLKINPYDFICFLYYFEIYILSVTVQDQQMYIMKKSSCGEILRENTKPSRHIRCKVCENHHSVKYPPPYAYPCALTPHELNGFHSTCIWVKMKTEDKLLFAKND